MIFIFNNVLPNLDIKCHCSSTFSAFCKFLKAYDWLKFKNPKRVGGGGDGGQSTLTSTSAFILFLAGRDEREVFQRRTIFKLQEVAALETWNGFRGSEEAFLFENSAKNEQQIENWKLNWRRFFLASRWCWILKIFPEWTQIERNRNGFVTQL